MLFESGLSDIADANSDTVDLSDAFAFKYTVSQKSLNMQVDTLRKHAYSNT